jgi:hypothetical protein
MSKTLEDPKLHDGTLVRHKTAGYEGRIEGTTEIKGCFTAGGASLDMRSTRQNFQYRVAVASESLRKIAPAEDLEVLEGVVRIVCGVCHYSFHSKPGAGEKPGGRCRCGGWICPACLACQGTDDQSEKGGAPLCLRQRQRQTRKLAARKKSRDG